MADILFVNACMRGSESRTQQLCREYLATRQSVKEVNLAALHLPPFDAELVNRRMMLQQAASWDDPIFDLAHQFANADEVVFGAPYWDLTFPATLKIYIEHVCVCGIAFSYTDKGECEGLVKTKHFTYISTCGGFVAEKDDLGYQYICGIANMFGVPEVRYITAQGLDVVDADINAQMDKARETMRKFA